MLQSITLYQHLWHKSKCLVVKLAPFAGYNLIVERLFSVVLNTPVAAFLDTPQFKTHSHSVFNESVILIIWNSTTKIEILIRKVKIIRVSNFESKNIFVKFGNYQGVYSLLMCYDTSGSWAEGRMGGPSGVGKGHTSLAICPAGPGQVVPSASPKHWFQQPWTVPREKNAQGNSTEFHGVWSTSEFKHCLIILSKCPIKNLIITDLALLFLDGHAFKTSGSCQLHRVTRERRP